MTQELEIEFKNMITKEEYHQLLSIFSIKDEQLIIQENHYFDTPKFSLKEQRTALRIREKNNTYTLTIKQPQAIGLLETHQVLSGDEAKTMLSGGKLVDGAIKEIISKFIINPNDIEYFGSLKTIRVEFAYENGLLVLDKSLYLNMIDYEVEFEVMDEKEGQKSFQEFLKKFNIPLRQTENKIKRFYLKKQQI